MRLSIDLLYRQIAGIPLLARNILALHKAGFKKITVRLPNAERERFNRKIAPILKKHSVSVDLVVGETLEASILLPGIVIPANALVETKLPSPFYRLVIEKPSQIAVAEKRLMETIRMSTPGPVAKYLNKRISLPISLRISRLGIHPNYITLANMVLGIFSGIVVARGTYPDYLLGAFLFQCASIFDGCDGEVAKLSFTTSKFGQYFDSLSDNGALLSFFIGLIAAFNLEHAPIVTLGLGALLLAGLAGLLWQMISFLKKHTQSASLATFNREYLAKLPAEHFSPILLKFIHYGKMLMSKDCFSLAFFFFALVGLLPWVLYIATFGTWVANGILLYLKLQPRAVAQDDAV
ncbi:MAG: CDP-alcohol phosphatidyltransferase family protein [Deltaproteobacteria bacterium]|nr:CDP-alcohol phosphatidyltransferase family protein [Deltaproteobacteria bacterium]